MAASGGVDDRGLAEALAGAYSNAVCLGAIAGQEARWEAVAKEAHKLLGPSPEERAVIEAAEVWGTGGVSQAHIRTACKCSGCVLIAAVDALRASRAPKPRYRVVDDTVACRIEYEYEEQGYTVAKWLTREDAERIARFLEADEAG